MTTVLVSFCNVDSDSPMLGLLEPTRGAFSVVELPPKVTRHRGLTGLAASDRYVYAGVQWRRRHREDSTSRLLILDRHDLSLVQIHVFQSVQRVHSLLVGDEALYAVSTGTDEVVRCELANGIPVAETVVWRPEPHGPREDLHHVNSLCLFEGALYVSAFGEKGAELWNSAREGYVANTATGDIVAAGLDHPHSLTVVGGVLAYCESQANAIRILGQGVVARDLPGYARGLCLDHDSLLIGTGVERRVSESTGRSISSLGGQHPRGRCAVVRVTVGDGTVEPVVELGAYAREIYDLLPLAGLDV